MTVKASLDIKFRFLRFTITTAHWAVSEPVPAELALLSGFADFLALLASKLAYNDHGVKLAVWVV